MTTDPARKDGGLAVNADTPKAGATVQMTDQGKVLISIPVTPNGDHLVSVHGRTSGGEGRTYRFAGSIRGPAPVFTTEMQVAKGLYTFEIVVKDMATGKLAADTIEFEVK